MFNVVDLPERSLQPRELDDGMASLRLMFAEQARVLESVMDGTDECFWGDVYDGIYSAVREGFAAKNLTPAERWALVVAAVEKEALPYATARAMDPD